MLNFKKNKHIINVKEDNNHYYVHLHDRLSVISVAGEARIVKGAKTKIFEYTLY